MEARLLQQHQLNIYVHTLYQIQITRECRLVSQTIKKDGNIVTYVSSSRGTLQLQNASQERRTLP